MEIVGLAGTDEFMIAHHEVALRMHFVRMRSFRHFNVGQQLWIFRVGDVNDTGPERVGHVTDIGGRAVDTDLSAPGAIEITDLFKTLCTRH